jgi:predicted Rossmann fold flavoprotein
MRHIVIVGGGAAGLSAAVAIKRERPEYAVTLLEAGARTGKKIRASGNGKCNITNRFVSPERYYGDHPDFIAAALRGYDYDTIARFLESLGILLVQKEEGKCFPMSMQASFVAETLLYEAEAAGVVIRTSCALEKVRYEKNGFILQSACAQLRCDDLVLAAGSAAAPQLGGNETPYRLAETLGHRIIEPLPALVQLQTYETWPKRLSGLKLPCVVTLLCDGTECTQRSGDVLFTNYGISGLAVLDISIETVKALRNGSYCQIRIDTLPHLSMQQARALLTRHHDAQSLRPLKLWLQRFIPEKLASEVLRQHDLLEKHECDISRKTIYALIHTLKHLTLGIADTRGFKGAEVALGGVDTREIDAQTMASLKRPHLYIIGEMLDVAGDRGGFNFHFAFTSALRAAKAIVQAD